MIILKKKRLVLVSLLCCLSIFTFLLASNVDKKTENETKEKSIETVSLPTTNKVIVLDAGHGVPDERSDLLTLINNIDLLQQIKCFGTLFFYTHRIGG